MFQGLSRRRLRPAAAGLFALFACIVVPLPAPAQMQPSAVPQAPAMPPIPPGDARFLFYRVFFPDDTREMPAIAMNGATIGYALAGTNFYRDVPAGGYHLTVATTGLDYFQSQDVAAAPGQLIFVKIDSNPSWVENQGSGFRRGTYYVTLVPPPLAALELPNTTATRGY